MGENSSDTEIITQFPLTHIALLKYLYTDKFFFQENSTVTMKVNKSNLLMKKANTSKLVQRVNKFNEDYIVISENGKK